MTEPTPTPHSLREHLLFCAGFGLLPVLLAWAAGRRPAGLLVGAAFIGGAWLLSLAFNRETARRNQLPGAIFPTVFLLFWALSRLPLSAHGPWIAAAALLAAALALACLPRAGRAVSGFYKRGSVPVAWGLSMAAMALAFYLVFTPLGLLMRLFGRDALKLGFDRQAKSYWLPHEERSDPEHYFRQF